MALVGRVKAIILLVETNGDQVGEFCLFIILTFKLGTNFVTLLLILWDYFKQKEEVVEVDLTDLIFTVKFDFYSRSFSLGLISDDEIIST